MALCFLCEVCVTLPSESRWSKCHSLHTTHALSGYILSTYGIFVSTHCSLHPTSVPARKFARPCAQCCEGPGHKHQEGKGGHVKTQEKTDIKNTCTHTHASQSTTYLNVILYNFPGSFRNKSLLLKFFRNFPIYR